MESGKSASRAALIALPARLWASLRRRLVARRIAASGLFDSAYYRATNFQVAASGVDPIRHFVKRGAAEGRDPHPMFDTSYYVRENPEITRSGVNPLLHFARSGAARGRRPHPRYSAEEYLNEVARRPRGGAARSGPRRPAAAERGSASRRLRFTVRPLPGAPGTHRDGASVATALLVCHVLPFPPRAGNEYRVHRLLRWLRSAGREVHVVVSPLPGEAFHPDHVRAAALEYPNLVLCERDGTLRYQSERSAVRAALAALDGERSRTFPREASGRVAGIERTFCPDHLMDVLARLGEALRPEAVVASYVFMSRSLRLFPEGTLRIIDTHDVFSTKGRKVVQFGVADDLAMAPEEEAAMLRRADVVVAIQPDEARELRALAPDRRVVTAGVDFDLPGGAAAPVSDPVVLCVASGNALNVRGVQELLSLAWPLVRRAVPAARLRIVGPVCDALDGGVDGVELLGRVDRLDAAYAGARVVVNPTVAGTGLKIKTLEALSHLRPLVSWPSGVDGLSAEVRRLCCIATDWYEFSRHVVRLLTLEGALDLAAHRDEIRRALSPEVVYAELLGAMERTREGREGEAAHAHG